MKVGIYAYLRCQDGTLHPAYAEIDGPEVWVPLENDTVFGEKHPVSLLEIEVLSDDGHTIKQGWRR